MDIQHIIHGFRGSQKPIYGVRCRLSPIKDSEQFNVWYTVLFTASQKVVKTVISRLQADGFTPDDYKVTRFRLAVDV